MDPKLQAAIEKSTLLSEDLKARLLEKGDKLSGQAVDKLLVAIGEAEKKKAEALAAGEARKAQLGEEFVAKAREIATQAPKKAMRAAEAADQKSEEEELENILSELDNV